MIDYDIDLCDNGKYMFAGVCKRYVSRDIVQKNRPYYYLNECPSYMYFIPK